MTPKLGNSGEDTPSKTSDSISGTSSPTQGSLSSGLVRPARVRRYTTPRDPEIERQIQSFTRLQEKVEQNLKDEKDRIAQEEQDNLVQLYRGNIDQDFIKELADPELEDTIVTTPKSRIPFEQIHSIVQKLATFKDIHFKTAFLAIGELFRRGGSAANASPIMSVQVQCKTQGTQCTISKADVQNTMQTVLGHQNTRKLAESMAPYLISINIEKYRNGSKANLKGDLANKLNKKLYKDGQEPLNPLEEICACTYAQWIPDLNSYTLGNRLSYLLQQDLEQRLNIEKIKQQQKKNKLKPAKDAKKTPQQPAKGRKGKKNMTNYQKKIQ